MAESQERPLRHVGISQVKFQMETFRTIRAARSMTANIQRLITVVRNSLNNCSGVGGVEVGASMLMRPFRNPSFT